MKERRIVKKRDNGDKEVAHPKPVIEVMANTRESIEGYKAATGLTFQEAALVLNLNEIRCVHFHMDQIAGLAMTKFGEPAKQKE